MARLAKLGLRSKNERDRLEDPAGPAGHEPHGRI